MTGRAVGSVFAAVMIIGCMAGKTGCRRTLELHILMAAATGDGCVFAGQFETGVAMVAKVLGFQAAVVWQVSHCAPSAPLCGSTLP